MHNFKQMATRTVLVALTAFYAIVAGGGVMQLGRKIGAWHIKEGLPYDSRVEYIGNDNGDARILLPLNFNNCNMEFKIKLKPLSEYFSGYLLSGRYYYNGTAYVQHSLISTTNPTFLRNNGTSAVGIATNYRALGYNWVNSWWDIELKDGALYFDGELYQDGLDTYWSGDENLTYLGLMSGAWYEKDGDSVSLDNDYIHTYRPIQVSNLSYSADGVKKFDGIAVRKDGVGYLYDRVSGQLFGNIPPTYTSYVPLTIGADIAD